MRLLGLCFVVMGVLLLAAGLVIGVPFTGIFLLGFVANGGREAGRELALLLPSTLLALGLGYGLLRGGLWLRRPPAQQERSA